MTAAFVAAMHNAMSAQQLNYRRDSTEELHMADTTSPSLEAFVASLPATRSRCILCSVDPEIERQAREGKAAGITYRQIGMWLETVVGEEPITKGRLERHFQQGHTR